LPLLILITNQREFRKGIVSGLLEEPEFETVIDKLNQFVSEQVQVLKREPQKVLKYDAFKN